MGILPIDVLRLVRDRFPELWVLSSTGSTPTVRDFLKLLGGANRVSYATVGRAFNTKRKEFVQKVNDLLDEEHIKESIENELGLQGVFLLNSEEEIISYIEEKFGIQSDVVPDEAGLIHVKYEDIEHVSLSKSEERVVKIISSYIMNKSNSYVYWRASSLLGLSFISCCVLRSKSIRKYIDSAFVIYPEYATFFHENKIDNLYEYLSRRHRSSWNVSNFIDYLKKNRSILILCGLDYLRSNDRNDDKKINQILKYCLENRAPDDLRYIIFLGGVPSFHYNSDGGLTEQLENHLGVRNSEIDSFFHDQWVRFSSIRGKYNAEESGSRLRRAQEHYKQMRRKFDEDGKAGLKIRPINIRVRSFLASNTENHAYFDPTYGFNFMKGKSDKLPIDIYLYKLDVNDQIESFLFNGMQDCLLVLRCASTGKYWVSDVSFEIMNKNKNSDKYPTSLSVRVDDIDEYVGRLRDLLYIKRNKDINLQTNRKWMLYASLGLRALVQDHWLQNNPLQYAHYHYKIADWLYRNQHSKFFLGGEFPYAPQWGDSRVIILSECVRHLSRVCQGLRAMLKLDQVTQAEEYVDKYNSLNRKSVKKLNKIRRNRGFYVAYIQLMSEKKDYGDFPLYKTKQNSHELIGSIEKNVIGIMSFSFSFLLISEIVGSFENYGDGKLLEGKGAYSLALDLIQLFSEQNVIGEPSIFLNPYEKICYYKFCGATLFHVGYLNESKFSFQKLIYLAESMEILDVVFDAKIFISKIAIAQSDINLFRENISDLSENLYGRLGGYNDKILNLFRERIKSVTDIYEYSVKGMVSTQRSMLFPVDTADLDSIHAVIASKRNSGTSDFEISDMLMCLNTIFSLSTSELHHEVIGFRISLAHILRKKFGAVAGESLLDHILIDIVSNGCSERVFLSFLLEAGTNLLEQGDSVRAYCSYLRPCYIRAKNRGYKRMEIISLSKIDLCFEHIVYNYKKYNENDEFSWELYIENCVEKEKRHIKFCKDHVGERFARDPLYAYSSRDALNIMKSFKLIDRINFEKSRLISF